MTATSQHGFHPDAESLSAFSEQVLAGRERVEVLAHLAVCGRCREVVALAREAADADEATAAAPPRKTIAPNTWWKEWRLVWVPTAVVVAFAVASISIYIEQADRHGPHNKIAEQNPTPSATPPAPSPTEQAKVEPPSANAPATPSAHTSKRAHSAVTQPTTAPAPPRVAAQVPSESRTPEAEVPAPGVTDREESRREAPRMSRQEAMKAPPEPTAGATQPGDAQQASDASEAKQKQAEEQSQEETETSRTRSFKAKAAPSATRGATPAGATETVTVTAAPPLETQPPAPKEPAPMMGLKRVWGISALANTIQLPGGRESVSIASGDHLLLAIDKAGALFLSEDRGVTWERISRQWTGRAIAVRRQSRDQDAQQAAPAAQNGTTGGSSPDAGAASPPSLSFELLNDKNETWVSTDGRTWTPE
jgi:hypothetical protein